jgi:hypothetical protein
VRAQMTRRLERLQRVVAALVGVGTSLAWLHGTFHDPNPRAHAIGVIVFRVAVCGAVLVIFMKRAAGKKMEPASWALLAFLLLEGIWRASTTWGSVLRTILLGVTVVGYLLEGRLARTAEPGGPAARGVSP